MNFKKLLAFSFLGAGTLVTAGSTTACSCSNTPSSAQFTPWVAEQLGIIKLSSTDQTEQPTLTLTLDFQKNASDADVVEWNVTGNNIGDNISLTKIVDAANDSKSEHQSEADSFLSALGIKKDSTSGKYSESATCTLEVSSFAPTFEGNGDLKATYAEVDAINGDTKLMKTVIINGVTPNSIVASKVTDSSWIDNVTEDLAVGDNVVDFISKNINERFKAIAVNKSLWEAMQKFADEFKYDTVGFVAYDGTTRVTAGTVAAAGKTYTYTLQLTKNDAVIINSDVTITKTVPASGGGF